MKLEEWIYYNTFIRKRFPNIRSDLKRIYHNKEHIDFDLILEKGKSDLHLVIAS
jgi:hypothetical protein